MSGKTNKLISHEDKKEYSKEAAEETKESSHGDNKFYRWDEEFKEARTKEIAFNKAHVEESAARAYS